MTNENVATMKADAKKTVSDLGDIVSHAKADAKTDVATMKADAKKTVSDLGDIMSHAKTDAKANVEKLKAKFGHDDELEKKAA
jgi:hypothetical protein